ncbi:hypothetical protein [Holospora curviuscula]|uniref:Uncharacterized protein n=1 Tax=Holospora curviuscula TaxID=1082868 RepID=A0A2S5RHT6_9PROT|nr:hypothetical protein [Holospora curviuscula]PPE06894.1 hypothetical protein HCUR_00108 [Holospora curviuscula]
MSEMTNITKVLKKQCALFIQENFMSQGISIELQDRKTIKRLQKEWQRN